MSRRVYDYLDRQVDSATLRELQTRSHGVKVVVQARTETMGATEWRDVQVAEARIQVYDPGVPSELTLTVIAPITVDTTKGDEVVPLMDWRNDVEITPWGTWLKVWQHLYVPGLEDDPLSPDNEDKPIVVPWGAFLVTEVTTDRNTQTIRAKDSLAMLQSRSYVKMADQRIVKSETVVKDRIDHLISAAWPHGTDPFLPLVDWKILPREGRNATAKSTEQYQKDRLTLIRSLLQRREFNQRPSDDYDLAAVIMADPAMESHYMIQREFDLKQPPRQTTVDIKAGQGLVSLKETKKREGLVNRAIVSWEQSGTKPDGTTRVAKHRYRLSVDLVATVNEEYSKVHVGQRLGLQTQDESPSGIDSKAEAEQRARRMILKSLFEAVTWDVECFPAYGLWVDDVVSMADAHGNRGYGKVTGMTVDLTQTARWALEVSPLNVVNSRSFGNLNYDVVLDSIQEWKTIYSPAVAEGMKKLTGWSATGGRLSTNKIGMRLHATGDTATVKTVEAYPPNNYDLARASVEIAPTPEKIEVRVGVGGNFGPWVTIRKNNSGNVSSDKANGQPQKVTKKFGVTVQIRGMGANGANVDLSGLTVEVPGISRETIDVNDAATAPGGKWVADPDRRRPGNSRSPREYVQRAHNLVGSGYPDGLCLRWVSEMLTGAAGWGGAYAKYAWTNRPSGAATWPKDTSPPIGAIVVWNSPTGGVAGHVGISIGGGKMISATGGRIGIQSIASFGSGGSASYFGAVEPY